MISRLISIYLSKQYQNISLLALYLSHEIHHSTILSKIALCTTDLYQFNFKIFLLLISANGSKILKHLQPQFLPYQKTLDHLPFLQILILLVHSYFTLKVENGELENVVNFKTLYWTITKLVGNSCYNITLLITSNKAVCKPLYFSHSQSDRERTFKYLIKKKKL